MLGYGRRAVDVMGAACPGFSPTRPGPALEGLGGFLDGALAGLVGGWLCNRLR
jgi:hypothetical protein